MRLDSPKLASLLADNGHGEDLTELLERRTALQSRLDGLADDYATGLLTKAQMARANATALSELKRLDDEIAHTSASRWSVELGAGETVRQAWMRSDDGWRRQLLDHVLKQVVVNRSARKPIIEVEGRKMRFDAEAIALEWRV